MCNFRFTVVEESGGEEAPTLPPSPSSLVEAPLVVSDCKVWACREWYVYQRWLEQIHALRVLAEEEPNTHESA